MHPLSLSLLLPLVARLVVYNLSNQPTLSSPPKKTKQVYLQFFLLDTLGLGDRELALVPLTLYLAGLGATVMTEWLHDRLGRKLTYLAGR